MKKNILTIFFVIGCLAFSYAQAPQKVNYQAEVRDPAGTPLAGGTNVGIRFTIHDQTAAGTVVFQESANLVTSPLGLITYEIGANHNLAVVNWGAGPKYLQIEVDLHGGTN